MIIVAGVVVDHAALVCVLAAVVLMLALRYHVAVSLANLRRSPTKSSQKKTYATWALAHRVSMNHKLFI